MSDFWTDRTVIGVGGTLASIAVALWRRYTPARPHGSPPWYVRIARIGSALTRLQLAEGTLDSVKESLLLEREEGAYLRQQLREARAEIERLSSGPAPPTSSAATESSAPSSGGSTKSRGVKTRKKRTT